MRYTKETWAKRRLAEVRSDVLQAPKTQKLNTLIGAASTLGNYVSDGAIPAEAVTTALMEAARGGGIKKAKLAGAIRAGIETGTAGDAWYPDEVVWAGRKDRAPDGCPYLLKVPGGSMFMVRTNRLRYRWVDRDLVSAELKRQWPNINIYRQDEEGNVKEIALAKIFERYGELVDNHFYTWYLNGPEFYEDDTGITHLQVLCGKNEQIDPVFHQDVEDWLSQVFGERLDRGKDWLAQVKRLQRPIAALYLMGKPGFGKGMLAAAVSRMFGDQVADYGSVAGGGFNSEWVTTPVAFLDEKAPNGVDGSRVFRNLVGGRKYPLMMKYKPASTIRVCPRIIIAANNSDALRLGKENLEPDDEQAIGERILFIRVPDEARRWLRAQGGTEFTDDWVDDDLGRPGKICEHIEWLVQNWEITQPGDRFLVDGDFSEWMQEANSRGGLAQELLAAVAIAAAGHLSMTANENPVMLVPGEGIYVSTTAMSRQWKRLTNQQKVPSPTRLGNELLKITGAPAPRVKWLDGTRKRAFKVHPAAVYRVADIAGVVETDIIREKLGEKDTEEESSSGLRLVDALDT